MGSDCSRRTGTLSAAQRRLKDLTNPRGGGSNLIPASVQAAVVVGWPPRATTGTRDSTVTWPGWRSDPARCRQQFALCFCCWTAGKPPAVPLPSCTPCLPAKHRPWVCSSRGKAVIMVSKVKILVCVVNEVPSESALFTPDTVKCECSARSLCHVIVVSQQDKRAVQSHDSSSCALPRTGNLQAKRLKMNKAILSGALTGFANFGLQEVFGIYSVSRVNGGFLWAKLERSFSVKLSWKRSCRCLVGDLRLHFFLDGGIRNVSSLKCLVLFKVLCWRSLGRELCVRELELVSPRDHGCFPCQTQSTGSEEPGVSPVWGGSWSWGIGGQRDPGVCSWLC